MRIAKTGVVLWALATMPLAVAQQQDPGGEPSRQTLTEQRDQVLAKRVEVARVRYRQGETTLETVNAAERTLLEARLASATTAHQRIELLRSQSELAARREKELTELAKDGHAPFQDLLEAKASKLTALIDLADETERQASAPPDGGNASVPPNARLNLARIRVDMSKQKLEVGRVERMALTAAVEDAALMLDSARRKLDATEVRLAHAKEEHQSGTTTLTEVHRAESRRMAAEAEYARFDARHKQAQHRVSIQEARIRLLELGVEWSKAQQELLQGP